MQIADKPESLYQLQENARRHTGVEWGWVWVPVGGHPHATIASAKHRAEELEAALAPKAGAR